MAARSVPLFAPGQDGTVERISFGQRRTPFLRRSTAMEAMVGHAAAELLTAPPQEAEGLLYLMLRLNQHTEASWRFGLCPPSLVGSSPGVSSRSVGLLSRTVRRAEA